MKYQCMIFKHFGIKINIHQFHFSMNFCEVPSAINTCVSPSFFASLYPLLTAFLKHLSEMSSQEHIPYCFGITLKAVNTNVFEGCFLFVCFVF